MTTEAGRWNSLVLWHFFGLTVLATAVASRRAKWGIVTFIACCVLGFAAVPLTVSVGGSGVAAAMAAFAVPLLALMWACVAQSSQEIAVENGAHGDYKKCPFCAESVRKEAIKCKHCGSNLEQ